MKIAVIGCGAMGGLFGAYLSQRNDVTVIDVDKATIAAINERGLTVEEPDGSSRTYHPHAMVSGTATEPVDLAILFVKATASRAALSSNAGILGPDTYLLTLQNGSGHEDVLGAFVDASHVVIGTTQHNASRGDAGQVRHGGSGATVIGAPHGTERDLAPIVAAFSASGLEISASDDVQRLVWAKLFTNVSASACTALLQMPMGYLADNAHAWQLCAQLVEEAVAVARAQGFSFDAKEQLAMVRRVCETSPEGLTSICVDIARGRKTEVDTITGYVVRTARELGVPAPGHELVLTMIHALEEREPARIVR